MRNKLELLEYDIKINKYDLKLSSSVCFLLIIGIIAEIVLMIKAHNKEGYISGGFSLICLLISGIFFFKAFTLEEIREYKKLKHKLNQLMRFS